MGRCAHLMFRIAVSFLHDHDLHACKCSLQLIKAENWRQFLFLQVKATITLRAARHI